MSEAIHVDQFLSHSPARVWRALTEPELIARWLMPNDFEATVGHRFTFRTDPRPGFDGTVHCVVLALEPVQLLKIGWRGGGLDTTVTWTLIPEGHGTRLLLEHAGFDPDDEVQQRVRGILDSGWRSHVLRALERVLR
jgi:uncharacterized protein YndB with AHSA1/START domain